jgi:hypothetical protein
VRQSLECEPDRQGQPPPHRRLSDQPTKRQVTRCHSSRGPHYLEELLSLEVRVALRPPVRVEQLDDGLKRDLAEGCRRHIPVNRECSRPNHAGMCQVSDARKGFTRPMGIEGGVHVQHQMAEPWPMQLGRQPRIRVNNPQDALFNGPQGDIRAGPIRGLVIGAWLFAHGRLVPGRGAQSGFGSDTKLYIFLY